MNYDTIYCICKHCDIHTFIQINNCDKHLSKLKYDQDLLKNIIDKYFSHHQVNLNYDTNFLKECYVGKGIVLISYQNFNKRIYPWDTYSSIYEELCVSSIIRFGYFKNSSGAEVIVKKFGLWYKDKYLIEDDVYNQVEYIGD